MRDVQGVGGWGTGHGCRISGDGVLWCFRLGDGVALSGCFGVGSAFDGIHTFIAEKSCKILRFSSNLNNS